MNGHIIPEAEKANTAVMDALARPVSISYIFLSLLQAKNFAVFGKNLKCDLLPLKNLVGS